jgi:hypothetical protein
MKEGEAEKGAKKYRGKGVRRKKYDVRYFQEVSLIQTRR